jgi:hypothetical protein
MEDHSAEQVANGMGRHYDACVRRFMAQDEKISSLERAVSALTPTVDRLADEFFNHDGGDGLKTIVLKHIAKVDARDEAEANFRNTRDQEIKNTLALSNQRTSRWMLIVAALSLIAAVAGVYIGVREYQRKISLVAPTSISQQPQQDAGSPAPIHY